MGLRDVQGVLTPVGSLGGPAGMVGRGQQGLVLCSLLLGLLRSSRARGMGDVISLWRQGLNPGWGEQVGAPRGRRGGTPCVRAVNFVKS